MKTNFSIYITALCISGMLAFSACSDDNEEAALQTVTLQMFLPEVVDEGEELTITGANLDKVIAVVLADNVEIKTFTLTGNSQISLIVPSGFSDGDIILKTESEQIVSRKPLKRANPQITVCTPSTVKIGEALSIKGVDLSNVKKITFAGSPDVIVEAIDFQRKCADEIMVVVPDGAEEGEATVRLETASGKKMTTPVITIEGGSLVEPITPASIVLFDFEEGPYQGGIWGAGKFVTEGNNTYYQGDGIVPDNTFTWFFAFNDRTFDPIPISSKVLKFDIMTLNPIEPGEYKIQWVMGDQWGWCTSGHFPMKEGDTYFNTNGKWMTVTLEFETLGIYGIGEGGTFGLACQLSTFNWSNICIDNIRIDPK